MKQYIIKYEDYYGEVNCVTVSAHSESHAIYQLCCVKEIYWVRTNPHPILTPSPCR